MGLNLSQLAADNFTRANVSPLAAPWALDEYGNPGFQIISDVCEPTQANQYCAEIYTYAGMPADQYASVTLDAALGSGAYLFLAIRYTDNGKAFGAEDTPAYVLDITASGGWFLFDWVTDVALASGSVTLSSGDVLTVAAIGTTLYVLHNSTQLVSVTNAAYSSGSTALGSYPGGSTVSTVQLSNYAMGSASVGYSISGNCGAAGATVSYSGTASGSVTADGSGNFTISGLANGTYTITPSLSGYIFSPTSQNKTVSGSNLSGVNFTASDPAPSNLPFLGSVVEVASAPIASDPFVGTYTVISAPPSGPLNPFLGSIRVVSGAPKGPSNPAMGQIVVIESPPEGLSDPYLGNAIV